MCTGKTFANDESVKYRAYIGCIALNQYLSDISIHSIPRKNFQYKKYNGAKCYIHLAPD
jgi:hypothetical protein